MTPDRLWWSNKRRRDTKRSGPFTEAGGGDVREQEFGGILVAEGVRELAGLEEQGATLVRVVGGEGTGENREAEDDPAGRPALTRERERLGGVLARLHRIHPRAELRGCHEEERGDAREVLGLGAAGALDEVGDHLVECETPSGPGPNCRRHDFEVGAGDGAEALFGGEGLVAKLQREPRVSPVGGVVGGVHERDRGAGMLGGAREREQGRRIEDHELVDLSVGSGEPAEEPEGEVDVLGVERIGHRRVEVVAFASEPRSPLHLSRPAQVTPHDPGELRVVLRVAGTQLIGIAGVDETLFAVLANRFQQPVARLGAVVGDHEGTRHQAREQLEHLVAVDRITRAHRFGGLQRATSREHRQAAQQPLLGRAQQVVGPVDRGAERLMTNACDPPATREEPKVEVSGDLTRAHCRDACGGELDRQRDAVEAPAHRHDVASIGVVDREVGLHCPGPLREQAHCVTNVGRRAAGVVVGKSQRRDHEDLLAADVEPLAAGREHPHSRTSGFDRGDEAGHRGQHVLAIVEDQQQLLIAQVGDEGFLQAQTRTRGHPEHARHRVQDAAGIAHGGQLTEPYTIEEPGQHLVRHL